MTIGIACAGFLVRLAAGFAVIASTIHRNAQSVRARRIMWSWTSQESDLRLAVRDASRVRRSRVEKRRSGISKG